MSALDVLGRFQTGIDNDVLLCREPGGLFVEKIYTKRSLREVESIAAATADAEAVGLPVPRVLGTGEVCGRPSMRLEFVGGRHVAEPSVCQLDEIASAMARSHVASSTGCSLLRADHYRTWLSLVDHLPDSVLATEISAVVRESDDWWGQPFEAGFTHGDYSPSNILFEGERLSSLLDFDLAGLAPVVFDLARATIFFSFDARDRFDGRREQRLLSAYRAIRPIPPPESRAFNCIRQFMSARMVVETHYYVNVARVVPRSRLYASPLNPTLDSMIRKFRVLRAR